MRIYVSQIYIEVGVEYPFSHHFQIYISEELTRRVAASERFVSEYAEDFDLIFRVSAKAGIAQPEVRGPTVFAKDRDVEFTIFLTFDKTEAPGEQKYRRVLRQLVDQIIEVLRGLDMDVSRLSQESNRIVERIVGDPKMIVQRPAHLENRSQERAIQEE